MRPIFETEFGSIPLGSSRTIGILLSEPINSSNGIITPRIGNQTVNPSNASNIHANTKIIINKKNWFDEFLASFRPTLATKTLPPGNVGIGSNEIHPKKQRRVPALVNG
jgi:hypothetical protein